MGTENLHWGPDYDWSYTFRAPKLEEVMAAVAASVDGPEPGLARAKLWAVVSRRGDPGSWGSLSGWRPLVHDLHGDALNFLVRALQRQRTP